MTTISTRPLAGSAVAALTAVALAVPAHALHRTVTHCTDADLHASYAGGHGAAGHVYGRIVLANVSRHACRTGGYSGVSYVGGGDGTRIGAPADRVDTADVALYVLRPGQRLRSPIDEVDALNYPRRRCHPTHVDGFRIYVPGSYRSQYVAHATTGCRNDQVHLLAQQPLRRP